MNEEKLFLNLMILGLKTLQKFLKIAADVCDDLIGLLERMQGAGSAGDSNSCHSPRGVEG